MLLFCILTDMLDIPFFKNPQYQYWHWPKKISYQSGSTLDYTVLNYLILFFTEVLFYGFFFLSQFFIITTNNGGIII